MNISSTGTASSQLYVIHELKDDHGEQSVAVAPFIINYSGCIFREYPGPWQVMLRQDSGEYACIAEQPLRYNLVRFCRPAPRAC